MLKAGSAARRLSLHFEQPKLSAELQGSVEAFLRDVDQQLQQHAPAWVGHCKLLITANDQSAYASITTADDTVRWTGPLPTSLINAELTVYAAIYNLTDAQVAATLDAKLASGEWRVVSGQ